MSIALRRKMFKLGGRANTHGMGLTSGLTMKQGPDGKPREAKILGGLLRGVGTAIAPGAQSLFKAARAGGGLKGIESFIRGSATRGRTKPLFAKKPSITTGPGGIVTSRSVKIGGDARLPLTTAQTFDRLKRAGLLSLPLAQLAGIASPTLDTDKDDPLFLRGLELAQDAARLPVQIPISITDALMGTGDEAMDNLLGFGPISQAVFGTKPREKGPDVDTTGVPGAEPEKKKSKEELKAENDARVEEYYRLLGGQGVDKLAALGAGLTAAAPALLEEDYGGAAQQFTAGLQPEIQRERDLRDAAATLAVGDVQAAAQSDRELLQSVLATGDTDAYQRVTKTLAAEDELGVGNVEGLPVKGNNKIDNKQLKRSKVYTDITGATKGKYVAINSKGQSLVTNNADQAVDFASA
tara:strand:+ start:1349 stop:2578 length:1230 start_codon:yes stop_codon:yes gene_type:complete